MTTTVAGVTVRNNVIWVEDVKSRKKAFSSLDTYKKKLMGIKTQMLGLGDIKIKVSGLSDAKKKISQVKAAASKPIAGVTRTGSNSTRSSRVPVDKNANFLLDKQARIDTFANSRLMQDASLAKQKAILVRLGDKELDTARKLRVAISNENRELRASERIRRETLRLQKQQSFAQERLNSSTLQMAGSMFSIFTAVQGIAAVTKTGMDFQKVNSSMTAVSKDSDEAKANILFMRQEARRLGTDLVQSSKGFTQMLAAGQGKMALSDMKELTTGVMEVSTVLGLSSDDTAGSIRALVQMMSKGKIMSEELS